MAQSNRFFHAVLKSPILWGGLLTGAFYALVHRGILEGQFVHQYFASHPVEYVATTLFFVGLAVLGIKVVDLAGQIQSVGRPLLPTAVRVGEPARDGQVPVALLDRLPARRRHEYLTHRVRKALEYIQRSGSTDGLEEELRYQADLDAHRVHASYGLVRMIIWAIPILGFLGTVIGIALAIGKLAPQALEDSLPQVMAGLTVAFNTTALALGLSMILMFALFLIEGKENGFLARVDERVETELIGRFPQSCATGNRELALVREMMDTVIGKSEELVRRQTELWHGTVKAAEKRWSTMADEAGSRLETSLAAAISQSLKEHALEMAAQEQVHGDRNRRNWAEIQGTLVSNTQALSKMHETLARKAEILGRVVGATDQVAKLEDTLNRNLAALAGSKNFEQTVMSLAAAIHLLNSRLGEMPADISPVQLDSPRTGQAA